MSISEDYKIKYLKYKNKYNNLKNQLGGTSLRNNQCLLSDIFDLDCFLPIPDPYNPEEDYIFNKRLSRETINFVRGKIQDYYRYFYNFMIYPNLSSEELSDPEILYKIDIPIIEDPSRTNLGKIDYDLITEKLKSIDITQFINNELRKKEIVQEINNLIQQMIDLINGNKSRHSVLKDITDAELQTLYQNNNTSVLPSQVVIDKMLNLVNSNYSLMDIYNKYVNLHNKINANRSLIMDIDNSLKISISIRNMLEVTEEVKKETDDLKKIKLMIKNKKDQIIRNIKDNFDKNPSLNAQILIISLSFYDNKPNNMIRRDGHANSVIIYRFRKNPSDTSDSYLCLRTEPHRHTNVYCRNSVRKTIRLIFSTLPNSYYLDYIINQNLDYNYQKK